MAWSSDPEARAVSGGCSCRCSGQATCPLTLPAAVTEIRGRAWPAGRGQGLRWRERFWDRKRRVVGRELGRQSRGRRRELGLGEGTPGPWHHHCLPAATVPGRPNRPPEAVFYRLLGQRHTVPFRLLLLPPGPFQQQRPAQPPPLRPRHSCHRAPSGGRSGLHWHLVPAKLGQEGWGSQSLPGGCRVGFSATEWSRQGDLTPGA